MVDGEDRRGELIQTISFLPPPPAPPTQQILLVLGALPSRHTREAVGLVHNHHCRYGLLLQSLPALPDQLPAILLMVDVSL